MKIGRGYLSCGESKIAINHLSLTWPMAYTTACTTVQAVIELYCMMLYRTLYV